MLQGATALAPLRGCWAWLRPLARWRRAQGERGGAAQVPRPRARGREATHLEPWHPAHERGEQDQRQGQHQQPVYDGAPGLGPYPLREALLGCRRWLHFGRVVVCFLVWITRGGFKLRASLRRVAGPGEWRWGSPPASVMDLQDTRAVRGPGDAPRAMPGARDRGPLAPRVPWLRPAAAGGDLPACLPACPAHELHCCSCAGSARGRAGARGRSVGSLGSIFQPPQHEVHQLGFAAAAAPGPPSIGLARPITDFRVSRSRQPIAGALGLNTPATASPLRHR